jgi:DNA-directed RNA polymerase subunit E"
MKACKNCHRLVDKPGGLETLKTKKSESKSGGDDNVCPVCNSPTSKTWQGYVIINDAKRSRIARKMNINTTGRYALKVR